MASGQIQKLRDVGQVVWANFLGRGLLHGGGLDRLVEEGVSGISFSPPALRREVEETDIYDRGIEALIRDGVRAQKEMYLRLMVEDARDAADRLLPLFESSGGTDGFVSAEVSPDLAYDTDATIEEARRLFGETGRKNVLVRVPATEQGLPAIAELTSEGINVNATLIFSVERYRKAAEAFIAGIEKRLSSGRPVDGIFSVAEFFVSRMESFMDRLLDEKVCAAGAQTEEDKIRDLYGKVAVANARLAYQKYKEIFQREGFSACKERGARPQRLAWESTGTRIPTYGDLKYVEEVVAPDTVCVMGPETLELFKDHGRVRVTAEANLAEARADLENLSSLGINIEEVAGQVEHDGVMRFSDAFFAAMAAIGTKRDWLMSKAA